MELGTNLKVPDETQPRGYKFLKDEDVPDYIRNLVELSILEVISRPEICYKKAHRLNSIFTSIEPSKHSDEVMVLFMVMARASMQLYEFEVHYTVNKPSSTEALRKAIALSGFVGCLFTVGLVDMKHLHHWMTKVLIGTENKFIRENLMEIVKESLLLLMREMETPTDSDCYKGFIDMIDAIDEENLFLEVDKHSIQ